jgi:threonine dehydratase
LTGPELSDIEAARKRLDGVARVTPVYRSDTLSQTCGVDVHLKAENLQRTGSFKVRGAYNRISQLSDDQRAAGVVAASAGNHGQAVAWAAREVGAKARIFMPQDAAMAKVDATRHYGADVELGGPAIEECLDSARAFVDETGATFVHPFEDPAIIAGQGTIGLELVDQVESVDTVLIPIGGGGLASGIRLATDARVVGVVPAAFPAMRVALEHGRVVEIEGDPTIADALHGNIEPGSVTVGLLRGIEVVEVTETQLEEAMRFLAREHGLVAEGAGAAAVAAGIAGGVAIVSGRNVTRETFARVLQGGAGR